MGRLVSTITSLNRNARCYLAMYALVMGGFFGISSVLLNLYLLRLGLGNEFVGTINGASLAVSALMAAPGGALGRRFGTRTTMLAGLLVSTVGMAIVPAAGSLPAPIVPAAVLGGSLLFFAGGPLFASNWAPYLMQIIEERDRPDLFSLRSAIQPLATLLFSLLAGVLPRLFSGLLGVPLTHPLPYRVALAFSPALMLAAFFSMCGTDREPVVPRTTVRQPRGTRLPLAPVVVIAAAILLSRAGLWVARSFYNVYLDRELHTATAVIGVVAAAAQLGAIPAALLMPAAARRWGRPAAITVGTVGIAAGLALLAWLRHWIGAAAGFVVMMGSFTFVFAASDLFSQELVDPEWRSVVAAICLAASTGGSAVMVVSSGFLVGRVGFGGIFLTGAALALASAALFAAFFLRRRERAEAA